MSRFMTIALLLLWACSEQGPTQAEIDEINQCAFGVSKADPQAPGSLEHTRLIAACAPLDWPIGCRLAWLTCTPKWCDDIARLACYQALCARVSDTVNCNPLYPDDDTIDHVAIVVAGQLAKVKDLSPATIIPRYEQSFREVDSNMFINPESPEALRWTMLTVVVLGFIEPPLQPPTQKGAQ